MKAKVEAILAALRGTEGTENEKPRGKYQHTQAYYSKLYGKDIRTIKRWCAEGKPLDDPKLMQELLSSRGRKPDAPHETGAEIDRDAESSPVTLDESFFAGSGVLAAIERLERAERERAGAYFRAISTRQPTAVTQNRFKEWMGIVEALRKLALDAPEIRKANDLTIDKAEMEAGVAHIFAAFRTAGRNVSSRATAKILAVRRDSPSAREEIAAVIDTEMETLFQTLTEISITEHAKAVAAEADAATAPPVTEPVEEKEETATKPKRAKPKAKRK
jgi:uncharacterized protein (UPF0335 family)